MVGKKETIQSFVLLAISKFFTYFLLLILGNFFILETYGKFSFVYALFNIVLFFCFIGLPYIYTPWIVKKKDESSVFYFLLLLSSLFFVLGLIVTIRYVWVLPLILSIPFLLFRNIGQAILRSKYKYHISQLSITLGSIITPVMIYFLIRFNELGITLGYAIGYIVTSLFIIFLTRKQLLDTAKKVQIDFEIVKEYLKKAIIISLISLSFLFLNWIDSTILGILSTFENVAKYNIASPISNIITLIPISLSMFLLTRSAEEKIKKYSEGMFHRTLRLSFSFSLILAILINSFLFLLVKIFFPKYVGIESYVMILSMGILFYAVYNLMYTYLAGKLTPEKALWPIVLAALLNIVLDIILIPKFGLYGITIATMLAHLVAFSLLAYKMDLLRKYYLVYLLVLVIPLSFYLKYFGLLLLVFIIPILFFARLIEKGDLAVVVKTIRSVFNKS